jgi:hypothetical protein
LQCVVRPRGRFEAAGEHHFRGKIMLQNPAIDVAIGLILMYLMLSLLCTVVNEYISTKLNLRSKTLRDALQKLIDDPTLLKNFYEHGLITSSSQASGSGAQSLIQAAATWVGAYHSLKNQVPPPTTSGPATATPIEAEHPSYLASGTVALALLGSLVKQSGATTTIAGVQTAIDALPVSKIKDAFQATMLKAGDDIDKLQQGIATWFDDSMDRLSGAYKRKMKWIAMLIGLAVAIGFNADSFKVATTLWNDPDRRASIIGVAADIAKNPPSSLQQADDQKKTVDPAQVASQQQQPGCPPPGGLKQPCTATKPPSPDVGAAIEQSERTLHSLPIGWDCPVKADGSVDYVDCAKAAVKDLTLVHFLGWILTALALSLGAPFWFDMLNKFINLRGAGGKPQREDQK